MDLKTQYMSVRHIICKSHKVKDAVACIKQDDPEGAGRLENESYLV